MEKWFNCKLLINQSRPQTKTGWLVVMIAGFLALALTFGFAYLIGRLSQSGAWTTGVSLVTLGLYLISLKSLFLASLYVIYILNNNDLFDG